MFLNQRATDLKKVGHYRINKNMFYIVSCFVLRSVSNIRKENVFRFFLQIFPAKPFSSKLLELVEAKFYHLSVEIDSEYCNFA